MNVKDEERSYQQEPAYQEIIIKFNEDTSQEDVDNFFKERPPGSGPLPAQVEVRPSFGADPELLDAIQEKAGSKLERPLSSLKKFYRVRLTEQLGEKEIDEPVGWFADNDEVEYAARAAPPGPPPTAPPFEDDQDYLDQATGTPLEGGVGARCAWDSRWNGEGVQVCDCEYGFRLTHNDLPDVNVISNRDGDLDVEQEHGTSVLGVLAGHDDVDGVTGICYGATTLFASESGGHRLDCLNDLMIAVENGGLKPGDVVLLEMQTIDGLPAEYNGDVHAAVTTLMGLEIVVVAAAGNADVDLDSRWVPRDKKRLIWQKEHDDYDDSGAILVGAGHSHTNKPHPPHSKIQSSAFGSRVDCQGWGNNVVTAGGGDLYNDDGPDLYYTHTFGGTSSAAAIVAGVVACLQSYANDALDGPLQPSKIRDLLRQDANGIPQRDHPLYPKATHHIGPLPDLCRLIAAAEALPDD